ncbi:MAG: 16S rRNA (cytosine(1402)-N(4))-methyltransferase, partial [Synergistaceae bacterium]|nr:16S rRNA (cytosine(1402)-N(4))-methyltransferase [Synergistaceae bacterium]
MLFSCMTNLHPLAKIILNVSGTAIILSHCYYIHKEGRIMHHQPVMLAEVLSLIETYSRHARILDGTLGLGGYSEAILSRFPASTVLGLDR